MIQVIALTEAGRRLGELLQAGLHESQGGCELWYKPKHFAEQVQGAFSRGDRLIFICATGIVVRTLAPVIKDKHRDPPVLVLDEQGQFVIPLLSGHEGGANEWGAQVAELLQTKGPQAKGFSTQLVLTTARAYLKPVYTVGLGCERHCPQQELQQLLDDCLAKAGLSIAQIDSINSIDIKADETGLIELGQTLEKPYQTWDVGQLSTMEALLSTHSDYVFNTVGVYGVAESAALYAAREKTGEDSELVLNKHKTAKATCAIARSYPAE
jgi:cobalt-precorrin 5A hydrolase